MGIVKRLHLLSLTPLFLVAAVSIVALFTAKGLSDAFARNRVAEAMVNDVSDLGVCSYEYLSHYEDRARIQWLNGHRRLSENIAKARALGVKDPQLQKLQDVEPKLARTFGELVDYHARRGDIGEKVFRERETYLGAQLLTGRQQAFAAARDLETHTNADIQREYMRLFASTAFAFLTLSILFAVIAYRTGTILARGLKRLQEGTKAMAQGQLDFTIDTRGEDELAQLGRAFNQLSHSLSASYVSIARLQAEIAERQKVEAALTQSEHRLVARTGELEALNRELEEFSYSVSHDMRTPLRAIDGFTQLLASEYRDRLDPEGARLLGVVRQNTARLSQLIEDILAYTRTGRMVLTRTPVDMHRLVQSIWNDLQSVQPNRAMELVQHPLPPAVGDPGMLRQAFTNLLDNAIKFSRPKPHTCIEVGAEQGENEHIYYVKDNGVGFDQRYARKLFGTFQRLHGVEEFEGTGIGLAIVKRIVTRHGGRVWAEGKVGEGATFYVALPAGRTRNDGHG